MFVKLPNIISLNNKYTLLKQPFLLIKLYDLYGYINNYYWLIKLIIVT